MSLAPIVLFVYNRPDHTRSTLEALAANDLASDSELIVFADGPKESADEITSQKIQETRSIAAGINGFKSVTLITRNRNMGLANSIIAGVTEVVEKFGQIIVMEDDLVTSPFFLTYMNTMLDLYKEEEKVISIHGYNYPMDNNGLGDTFFLKGADCWGWATWKRGWELFESDGTKLMKELRQRKIEREFNFANSYDYIGLLNAQINGWVSSWAVRWYASAFLKNKYTLYPKHSLVVNIGMDGSGTHCGPNDMVASKVDLSSGFPLTKLLEVKEDHTAKKRVATYFRNTYPKPFGQKVRQFIRGSFPYRVVRKIISYGR